MRVLGDRILVKKIDEDPSVNGIKTVVSEKTPIKGIVKQVGTDNEFQLQENDEVLFPMFAGIEVIIDNEIYLIMRGKDILIVTNN